MRHSILKHLLLGCCLVAASLVTGHAQLIFKAGTTTTGAPGTAATLRIHKLGYTYKFNFTIPQGPVGASPFVLNGNDAVYTAGKVGLGTTTPSATLDVNGSTALRGAIRVPGAGIGTSGSVFVHRATAANSSFNFTAITNPLTDGDPNAILIITANYNPGGGNGVYFPPALGVIYLNNKWYIFSQDTNQNIPLNAAFNVLVVKP